jgi:hypothetical protein
MHPRWSQGTAVSRLLRAPIGVAALLAVIALTAAGCSAPAKTKTATLCGTARTVANVPVKVEVARGKLACPTAVTVERDYTKAIAAGRAPGNGGGGPVKISGWMCLGLPVRARQHRDPRGPPPAQEVTAASRPEVPAAPQREPASGFLVTVAPRQARSNGHDHGNAGSRSTPGRSGAPPRLAGGPRPPLPPGRRWPLPR